MPEEGHRCGEVGWGGEDCVPWVTGGAGVEEQIRSEQAVDCAAFWEGAGEGLRDYVGGAESGVGDD